MTPAAALAEIHLLGLVAEAHEDDGGDEAREGFEGALDAAVAAGLVPADDRANWLRRFDAHGEEAEASLEGARIEAALAVLDRLARAVAAAEEPDADAAEVRFQDALEALYAVGALDESEVEWWARRLGELPGPRQEEYRRAAEEEEDDEPAQPRLLGLLAAYPGAPRADGAWIVSVECYDDGIVVRWQTVGVDALEGDLLAGTEIGITDDAGTEYLPGGTGAGGSELSGADVITGTTTFAPAVPAAAARLRVQAPGTVLEIDVSGLAERDPV